MKKDIKKLTKDQALKEVDRTKRPFNFRFQKINGQIKNPAKINETKRNIARLKSFNNEKMPKKILNGIVVSDKPDKTITVMDEENTSIQY